MNEHVEQYIRDMVSRIPHGIETKKDGTFDEALSAAKSEILTKFEATSDEVKKLQMQLDGVDAGMQRIERGGANPESKSLVEALKDNDDIQRLVRDRKGRAIFEIKGDQVANFLDQKTILSSSTGYGTATGGVINVERQPGIVAEARRPLRIRDLLVSRPTTSPLIYFVKVQTPLAEASPQVEAQLKAENSLGFSTATAQVQTIATFIRGSKQLLEDFAELMTFLETSLPYYVNRAVERQLISGDGTGVNLNGLLTQSTAFNASLLPTSGWTRIDQILAAAAQIQMADEVPATWVALNPRDLYFILRTKDSMGRFLLDGPQTQGKPMLWDLMPVATNAIPQGTFLVGNSDPAAALIRDRLEMQFDVSSEDSNNFQLNLLTLRAECRLALVVMRPASFVSGTFTTSPAGL